MTQPPLTPFDGALTVTLAPDVRLLNAFRQMLEDNGWYLVQQADGRNTVGGLFPVRNEYPLGEASKHRFTVVKDKPVDRSDQ